MTSSRLERQRELLLVSLPALVERTRAAGTEPPWLPRVAKLVEQYR